MATTSLSSISGHIVDVVKRNIYNGIIHTYQGKIDHIEQTDQVENIFLLPGLIDAHIHIESSMLIPSEFARLAVIHGTVATVSDPHEIANVLGVEGVHFMIENGSKTPFNFNFGAPSCVPATSFETSGQEVTPGDLENLLQDEKIGYLAEMMNFPGVIYDDPQVKAKLDIAKKYNKPIDGHAPGVTGTDLQKYAGAGISTDHECFTFQEALEKVSLGMHILIREGSAARNFDELIPLLAQYPEKVMFCSDDKHPDDLVRGHINELIKHALADGYDFFDVLRACTFNPVMHYNLSCGLLQEGDPADLIIVDDLENFNILGTYIGGVKVAERGKSLIQSVRQRSLNNFKAEKIDINSLQIVDKKSAVNIICAEDGQLTTRRKMDYPKVKDGNAVSDTERDILKLVVLNRYGKSDPAIGFIQGTGLKSGAIASTIAHDSHNIICAGTDDESILRAINLVIDNKGGISVADSNIEKILPLPVAGLMSDKDGFEVAKLYEHINDSVKMLGSPLRSPFMTLSFMALLVIPELKLSDKGLFDSSNFQFTNLFVNE